MKNMEKNKETLLYKIENFLKRKNTDIEYRLS